MVYPIWVRKAASFFLLYLLLAPLAPLAPLDAQRPVTFTAEQDHQNMMDQLGITELRPGPSGDENAPNHANYDEAHANPYPKLPDPLRREDGTPVTTPAAWWDQRRPELVELFSREIYGRVPAQTPKVTWQVVLTDHERIGFTPVVATRLIGHVENAGDPALDVAIRMTLVLPENAGHAHPVPVLIMFRPSELPAPAQPSEDDLARINAAAKDLLTARDSGLAAVFARYPAYLPIPAQERNPFAGWVPGSDPPTDFQIVTAGWGFAALDPVSIQADNGAGLTRGIIGLVNHGQPRRPDDWGALRAWSWGAGRALDYLASLSWVDAHHVGIEGVSRYGKAALVTLAFDQRFSMGLIGSSGEGGAKLHRRNFGEAVESLTGGEYYWMAGNFLKYGAEKSRFGTETANDLPVDAHELIALCAPRLVFLSYGIPEKGDAKWLDQRGSYMAAVAAQPVYRLLGAPALSAPGFPVGDDPRTAVMPPVNTGLLEGRLAWRQDDGGHTDAPNVKTFLAWANRWMQAPGSSDASSSR